MFDRRALRLACAAAPFTGKPDVESVLSQLEAQGSEWSQATIKLLSKMSPTSLKVRRVHSPSTLAAHHAPTPTSLRVVGVSVVAPQVTLRALNEGARLPLDRAFVVEYRLSQVRGETG